MDAEPQEILPGANITFSFDVRWQQSDTPWIHRWDAYLAMRGREVARSSPQLIIS
jgi:hypothetical protein